MVPKNLNNLKDFNVLGNFQFYSDHRPITIQLDTNTKFKNKVTQNKTQTIDATKKNQYEKELKSQIDAIGQIDDLEVNEVEGKINAAIRSAAKKIKIDKEEGEANIPKEINDLIRKRQKLLKKEKKENKEKIELNLICKLVKKKLREWNETKNNQIIQEILDTTNSTKTIRKNMSIGRYWITNLQDEAGKRVTTVSYTHLTLPTIYSV